MKLRNVFGETRMRAWLLAGLFAMVLVAPAFAHSGWAAGFGSDEQSGADSAAPATVVEEDSAETIPDPHDEDFGSPGDDADQPEDSADVEEGDQADEESVADDADEPAVSPPSQEGGATEDDVAGANPAGDAQNDDADEQGDEDSDDGDEEDDQDEDDSDDDEDDDSDDSDDDDEEVEDEDD